MILLIVKYMIAFVIAYLIGSIPTGYLIVKKLKGIDIRKTGSGSTGATNVKRILGTKWFFTVMLIDALKGIIPVLLAVKFINDINFYDKNANYISLYGLGSTIAAIGAIIGHSKSIFLGFTGGKSVATGIGTLIALCWPVGLIVAGVWAIITFFTKFVSLGSVIAISLAPILMNNFQIEFYHI